MTAPTMELGTFATFLSGGTPSAQNELFWSGPICWASPKDMHDRVISDTQDHISEEAVRSSATRVVPPNTILVVARSGILVRRLPVALTAVSMAFNQDIKAIVVDENVALPEYVTYALMSAERDILSNGVKKGATVHSLVGGYLEKLRMPVPPIPEQKRIVDILDRASGIQRLRKAADDKVRELVPALFVDMFGDPASNPKGWETKSLKEVSHIGSGITKGRRLDPSRTVSVPYLRVANVQDGKLDLSEIKTIDIDVDEREKYALRAGDIVMTEGGDIDKLGRGYVWQGELPYCAHQNHVFRVRVEKDVLQPFFVSTLIGTSHGKSYFLRVAKRTTGIASINKTQLGELPVWLPPISMQTAFVSRLEALHACQEIASRAASTIEATAAALSRQVFG